MQAQSPPQQELLHTQQETRKGGGVGDHGAAVTAAMRSCVYVVSGGGDVPREPLAVGCGVTVPADVPSVLLLHSSSPLLLWRVRRPLRSGGSHYDWSWWCWRRR
ncbi:hypothetical protein TcCL_NonESM07132 [Trypanosoma cruzi]|nr:hypothetical protein TcCL_NonESM07132 [Trypanosoma cruzi]